MLHYNLYFPLTRVKFESQDSGMDHDGGSFHHYLLGFVRFGSEEKIRGKINTTIAFIPKALYFSVGLRLAFA